ncbi:PREDICTED: uncharacterized protein LOC103776453, partial [Merops nubicus]|uniref:uncharacterized protein LOC103776453 n=1 Tax=Merops nubicus TaxID=57421 RepID=UPI0004F06DD9
VLQKERKQPECPLLPGLGAEVGTATALPRGDSQRGRAGDGTGATGPDEKKGFGGLPFFLLLNAVTACPAPAAEHLQLTQQQADLQGSPPQRQGQGSGGKADDQAIAEEEEVPLLRLLAQGHPHTLAEWCLRGRQGGHMLLQQLWAARWPCRPLMANWRGVGLCRLLCGAGRRLKVREGGDSEKQSRAEERRPGGCRRILPACVLCGSQLLQRVWEADLEACQLLIRGFQLKETSCCGFEEEENQMDELEMAADGPSDSEKRKEGHFPKGTEWDTVPCAKHRELKEIVEDISCGAEGHLSEEFFIFSAELGEKCEAISEKLVRLEDQLQNSACRVDEGVIQSLQREIQVVKETLQTVLLQLQPAREAGEEKAGDFLCDSWCPGKQDLKE